MSGTNRTRKLKFGVLASIYTYYGYMYKFFCLLASRIYATYTFLVFGLLYPKLIEVGIEIWYADGCVGLHLVGLQVALLSQRRRAVLRVCQMSVVSFKSTTRVE